MRVLARLVEPEGCTHHPVTSVQVYIELIGESGTVGEQKLRNNNINQLERNQKDEFVVTGGTVGQIKQVLPPIVQQLYALRCVNL